LFKILSDDKFKKSRLARDLIIGRFGALVFEYIG
jgi:hypothetical protein